MESWAGGRLRRTQPARAGTSGRPAHAASPDYAVEQFASDPGFLSEVVRFDLPRLGDIGGLRGVHLQCHIGTDTVSLARLGARMTGLDFSAPRWREAPPDRRRWPARDVRVRRGRACTTRVERPRARSRSTWCTPGSARCAGCPTSTAGRAVVAGLLRPGGRLFIREGHPMLWALDDARHDGLLVLEYPVLRARTSRMVFDEGGTYVETDAVFTHEPDPRVEPRPRRDRHRAAATPGWS